MSSVSFIIPVFNKSSFLKLVINSLKNQLGNFKREFIFIDDGSTDNSLEIIKNLVLTGIQNIYIFNSEDNQFRMKSSFYLNMDSSNFINQI